MSEPTPAPIDDRDEVLNRQVHPALLHPAQIVMSTAFTPSDVDGGLLSTLRGSVAPAEAHRRWVEDGGRNSAGTWGVAVSEALDLELECVDDSCLPDSPDDHASIDFNPAGSKAQMRQVGRKLRNLSVERGALFIP